MGAVTSLMRAGYLTLRVLLAEIGQSNADWNELLSRISAPSLPVSNPTVAFWQQNTIHPELVDLQSDVLPQTADVVIIGSGISGASIAYTILTENEALKKQGLAEILQVVILDARQICSGATGRNGGHIKCSPYLEYPQLKERFGPQSARKIVDFERRALPTLLDLVDKRGLKDAEAREVETLDVFTDASQWNHAKKMAQESFKDIPELEKETELYEAEEACKKYAINSDFCHGVVKYTAGALWPYRMITSLFGWLLSNFPNNLCIEANTPVTAITMRDDLQSPFLVHTPCGEITARHVVHATNGFAANLVPGFSGKLFPVRGHMTAQKPGDQFPELDGSRSWCVYGRRGYEYITQRPGKYGQSAQGIGGELMVGGGVVQSPSKGMDEFGIWRDDQMSAPICAYLDGIMPVTFGKDNWGNDVNGSRIKQAWVGCLGFTADLLPFVGKLEASLTGRKMKASHKNVEGAKEVSSFQMVPPAEWVSAGFNGEGMVLTWLSGVAVGLMILGRERAELESRPGMPEGQVMDWLPQEFLCTKARVDRANVAELALLL